MIKNISVFFIILILTLPVTLISGPAIPDITITFTGIFFLFLIVYEIDKYKKIFSEKIFIFSIFFWIYLITISFTAENKILSFRDAIIFLRILIIPIFLYFWIFSDTKNLKVILNIIFFSVLFVCFDSIYQFMQYDPEYGFGKDIFGFKSNWYGRLTGPFYEELIPGAYVSKLGLLGLIFLFINIKNILYQNISSVLYLTLIGIVTFISGERMALATFLLGIFFLIIFYKNKRIVFITSLFFILFANIIIYKTHPIYNDFKVIESTPYHLGLLIEKKINCKKENQINCKKKMRLQPEFTEVLKEFNKSAYGEIYKLGWKMFLDHKIFGVGLNNFTYLCENDLRYKNVLTKYKCVTHPHNIYLQWIVESGIIGFFIFITYLFILIYFILKNNFNKFSLVSLSTLLILFWPIMSTGSLLKNWNGIITFLIIGISLTLSKLNKEI